MCQIAHRITNISALDTDLECCGIPSSSRGFSTLTTRCCSALTLRPRHVPPSWALLSTPAVTLSAAGSRFGALYRVRMFFCGPNDHVDTSTFRVIIYLSVDPRLFKRDYTYPAATMTYLYVPLVLRLARSTPFLSTLNRVLP